MLSRSSSNATNRLHRVKSTSSVHATTPGHQRLPTTTDPFVLRQQAETAAVEAYARARLQDEAAAVASKPRPSRRRSQNTGRSEGSHFADARRRCMQNEAIKQPAPSHHASPAHSKSVGDEETVVTRRRSIIPPAINATDSNQFPAGPPPLRKGASDYTDGSPAPRYSQLDEAASTLHTRSLEENQADGYAGNLAQLSNFAQSGPPHGLWPSAYVPSRDLEVEDVQMIQPKRVRQRKSFLGSFQKRHGGFDTALPPFNHADSDTAAPNVGLSLAPLQSVPMEQRKTRNFSDTLKGRLKKVFRKASKLSMPVQHVHAKDFHFSVRGHDVSDPSFVDYTDPFMTVAAEEPRAPQPQKFVTAQSTTSTAQESTSKSRVTSWANSTLAMSSVRTSDGPFAVAGAHHEPGIVSAAIHEASSSSPTGDPPVLKRSDSASTLRKASSFFGRPIRNKLRRSSRPDLRGSGESQGLYSALQSRIRTSRSTEAAHEAHVPAPVESNSPHEQAEPSALASLPSQRQYNTSSSRTSQSRHSTTSTGMKNRHLLAPTIRPVTPDLAPVQEAASAEADRTVIHHEVDSPVGSSPKSALRRSHAVKAPPPSKEQLLRRKERAESRWTNALMTGGLSSYANENPYELPSLSHPDRAHTPSTALPLRPRADVISPSLYSRATDGASPRPYTPDDVGMTTITITGREVRKYDISPPKAAHRHQASREWRRWLSDEMNGFADDEQLPRPTSGASMNGRYPVVNRSRNPSQQSVSRRPEGEDTRGMHSMARSRKASIESAMHTHASNPASRHRTLSKPKSIAEIEAAAIADAIPKSDPCTAATGTGVRSVKAFKRPKSAFELRVNYKSNATDRSKPLEVRRKLPDPNILEDHTMLNIYAGPYATGANSENQRPAELEGSVIPALSSSEWLGSAKKKSGQEGASAKPSSKRSPGQRMVTSWLGEKSKENVGAFV